MVKNFPAEGMPIEQYLFKDDGVIPNSKHALLVYRNQFTEIGSAGASFLEQRFASNNWRNSWDNGIFPFHHYHSNTHEVLGIYQGTAVVQFGGENGKQVTVHAGDVIIIPAGVGHKKVNSEGQLGVIGAYPNGMEYDLLTGKSNERPRADKNIARVPIPVTDPIFGKGEGLTSFWRMPE